MRLSGVHGATLHVGQNEICRYLNELHRGLFYYENVEILWIVLSWFELCKYWNDDTCANPNTYNKIDI